VNFNKNTRQSRWRALKWLLARIPAIKEGIARNILAEYTIAQNPAKFNQTPKDVCTQKMSDSQGESGTLMA